jgi:two-component system, OmpR family, alkaline phosphatase synthesis response regulator PhoP
MILLVDDHSMSGLALKRLLTHEGLPAVYAADGTEAMQTAERVRPHLIVLDDIMPNEGGVEVLRKLRSHPTLSDTSVIVLSGMEDAARKAQAQDLGICAWITKGSADWQTLLKTIRECYSDRLRNIPHPDPPSLSSPDAGV